MLMDALNANYYFYFFNIRYEFYSSLILVYMCVKLDSYPPHPINTYICGMTITPRVCNDT